MEKIELKEKYINYFLNKNHVFLKPASLLPADSTTLFTSAGIQQLVPFMINGKEPDIGNRLVNYQKCLRLTDIDNIGDSYHHTFFEMLGNWSLNDYFKKEVIEMSLDFLVNELKIDKDRLAVSVFEGNEVLPRDNEAAVIWKNLGIPEERIAFLGVDDNWWPSVNEKGPCGTDTEIFYWRSLDPVPKMFNPNDERWVEIWNNVFIQYNRDENMNLIKLQKRYIDTGMGVERVTSILNGVVDNYESELFKSLIGIIEEKSNKKYQDNKINMRIIADHIRAITMICSDDKHIFPTNKDRGYVLRRLIRRMLISVKKIEVIDINDLINSLVNEYIELIDKYYPYVKNEKSRIIEIILNENNKFNKILIDGTKKITKAITIIKDNNLSYMDSKIIFRLYETHGVPIDLTYSILDENNILYNKKEVEYLIKEHKEKSRQLSEKKFGAGLTENIKSKKLIYEK